MNKQEYIAAKTKADVCCNECNGDTSSDCCGAEYDEDMGICFDCKEHCESAGCGDENCVCHAGPEAK